MSATTDLHTIMSQHHGDTPADNVVIFPASRRTHWQRQAISHRPVSRRSAPHRRTPALSGAALNARLTVLLCICVSGAVTVVSAAHFLHG